MSDLDDVDKGVKGSEVGCVAGLQTAMVSVRCRGDQQVVRRGSTTQLIRSC
jgi:hypothetical protein